MKKIMISSIHSEGSDQLISLLKVLFPECEICLILDQVEDSDSGSIGSLPDYEKVGVM